MIPFCPLALKILRAHTKSVNKMEQQKWLKAVPTTEGNSVRTAYLQWLSASTEDAFVP
jgi:hypothetical protein